jgi:hypothetical protein
MEGNNTTEVRATSAAAMHKYKASGEFALPEEIMCIL